MSARRRLACTVSALALLGATGGYAGHRVIAAGAEAALAGAIGVAPGRTDVDLLSGRVVLRDIVVQARDGWTVRIGALALQRPGLVGAALAADTFSVENLAISGNGISYGIPRLDVVAGSMTPADIRALFDTATTTPMSERVARLNAESIVIPQMLATSSSGGITSRFVYNDVRFVGVKGGVVRSIASAGGTFESQATDAPSSKGAFGPSSATAVDLPWIAKSYLEPAGPQDKEARVAYATVSIEGITATSKSQAGEDLGTFSVSRIVGRDFRTKPTREPWLGVVQSLATRQGKDVDSLPLAERSRLVTAMVDMMEASDVALVEATDMRFAGAGTDGNARIARMSYAGAAVGRPAEMRMEGLEIVGKDVKGRVGTIVHSGFSFSNTLKGLRETLGSPDFDPTDFDPRKLVPELGTFSIRDVDIDAPGAKGAAPSRVGVKTFEVSATEPLGGIPTALRFSVDRLTMALPPQPTEDGLKDLVALGYKDVDLSMGLDARWREADNDLTIGNVGVQGVNMGAVALRGTVGNVTKDVFTGDATMAQIALFGATVKQVALTIDNKGLAERLLDREAKRQKRTPDQLRKELGGAAQMMIPAMLGNTPSSKAVAAAVAKFIAKPNRLVVTAKAKNPSGLGAAELLMAGGSPADILSQIDLTATAE